MWVEREAHTSFWKIHQSFSSTVNLMKRQRHMLYFSKPFTCYNHSPLLAHFSPWCADMFAVSLLKARTHIIIGVALFWASRPSWMESVLVCSLREIKSYSVQCLDQIVLIYFIFVCVSTDFQHSTNICVWMNRWECQCSRNKRAMLSFLSLMSKTGTIVPLMLWGMYTSIMLLWFSELCCGL